MRHRKIIWGLATFGCLLLIPVLALYALKFAEQPRRILDVYTENLHGGNWVPDIFPHDIVNIYEQHDIDTNEVWLRFDLTKKAIDPISLDYEALEHNLISEFQFRRPRIPIWRSNWWLKAVDEKNSVFVKDENSGIRSYIVIDSVKTVYWYYNH